MLRTFAILLFGCLAGTGWSQNLVPNPGFEAYTAIPDSYGQWDRCQYWWNLNGETNYMLGMGSPDYLHDDSMDTVVGLPVSTFGYVLPHTGDAIMGLASDFINDNFREYISAELETPMVPGISYTVSFWITNGISDQYGGVSCDHLGVYFSGTSPVQLDHEPLPVTPQLEIPGEVWTTDWQQFTFTIVPTEHWSFITIGQFAPTTETSWTFLNLEESYFGAYYFFDDISVTANEPIPHVVSEIRMPNVFTPDGDGNNDLFVPVSMVAVTDPKLRILNRWGNPVVETDLLSGGWSGTLNGDLCPEGVYFWIVEYTGTDGKTTEVHGTVTLVR